jgi:uncharacterized tellurite resistance protein B-like protein
MRQVIKNEISAELKSHFLRLYQMAITDDNFSPLELKMLYRFAEERNIPNDELDRILLSPFENSVIPELIETRIEYLYDLTCMIWADNIVTEDERNTLKKYCRKFNFLDENIEAIAEYLIKSVKDGVSKEQITNQIKG